MNANEVVESYITDVALQLPRRQRNDVAFELSALLHEELQARAEAHGRPVDATMAIEFLTAFGRPVDVAARYRPQLTIIDPSDGHAFWRATVIGLILIWSLSLLQHLAAPMASGWDLLGVLSHWWGGTVIPSLWWPGLLVASFGTSAWVRRRWPHAPAWQPRARDRISGGRAALVATVLGIVCGLGLLIDPRGLLDLLFAGRAAPAAYEVLTYTDRFRQGPGPWLYALLAMNIPLYLTVIVMRRWPPVLRRAETALGLLTGAAMTWVLLDGPIFISPVSDRVAKILMALIIVMMLVNQVVALYRRVRPSPNQGS